MANIRDVAKKAGVSITTVSRILNGDADFKTSPQTRDAVNNAIKELKYVPTTKINKMHIGVILPYAGSKYSDPYVTTILESIENSAEKRNMVVVQRRNYAELTDARILDEFLNSEIRGIICMERLPEDMLKKILNEIPHVVYIDCSQNENCINNVGFSHAQVTTKVMKYLINECGYKRIALMGEGDAVESYNMHLEAAVYREMLRRNNIKYDPELIKDSDSDPVSVMKITEELMKLKNPPDCIWAPCDQMAVAILNELTRLGYKCPQDVGVFGYNDNTIAQHTVPALSTIRIPMKEMGYVAVDRLYYMIHQKQVFPVDVVIQTEIIIRESTRKVK